jgi:hypothetical protein
MSHNVRSRLELLAELSGAVTPGGWLIYAEVCEGYGPREIDLAVNDSNLGGLVARLRQIRNGIVGGPGFRFFVAGTVTPALEALGMTVREEERDEWHGLPTLHRVLARRDDRIAPRALRGDSDYATLPAELSWLREEFVALSGEPASAARSELVRRRSALQDRRLAPLLLYHLMLDQAPTAFRQGPSIVERAAAKLPHVGRHGPDWEALQATNAELITRLTASSTCASSS